jgi:hypothetical protein
MDKFSARHGFEAPNVEITVRHEAPDALREIVVDIAYEAGLTPHSMQTLVCALLRIPENRGKWSAFPNVDGSKLGVRSCVLYHSWFAERLNVAQ